MKTLQITCLKEYYESLIEDIQKLQLTVLTYGSNDGSVSLIVEGEDDMIDLMEDFINGEAFI